MAKKSKPPPEPLPNPDDELPPEIIRRRTVRALERAFTFQPKPLQPGRQPKGADKPNKRSKS